MGDLGHHAGREQHVLNLGGLEEQQRGRQTRNNLNKKQMWKISR